MTKADICVWCNATMNDCNPPMKEGEDPFGGIGKVCLECCEAEIAPLWAPHFEVIDLDLDEIPF
jgi:hypothetical protein